jgi:hypothetical protein
MSVQVVSGDSEFVLDISGWTAAATLRRKIIVPYTSIENVQAGNFKFPWTAVRRTGIAALGYKAGHFVMDGEQYFLSYHDADKVVILDLKGHEFDKMVLESADPEQLANTIAKNCSTHK